MIDNYLAFKKSPKKSSKEKKSQKKSSKEKKSPKKSVCDAIDQKSSKICTKKCQKGKHLCKEHYKKITVFDM